MEAPPDSISELVAFDKVLPDIVKMIIGDNPAQKSPGLDRLESHLGTCDALPLRQVYGLLTECCEGPKLTRNQSVRFQWLLVRYFAKHDVVGIWPQVWPVVQASFEDVVVKKWQTMSASTPRNVWMSLFRDELARLLPSDPLAAAIQHGEEETTVSNAVLVQLLQCKVGKSLYQTEQYAAAWEHFVTVTKKKDRHLAAYGL